MSDTNVVLLKARLAGLYKEIGYIKEELKKCLKKDDSGSDSINQQSSPEVYESNKPRPLPPYKSDINLKIKENRTPSLLEQTSVKHRIR